MIIMNTVWLKIAATVVLLVVIFVIISKVANQVSKPAEPERTVGTPFVMMRSVCVPSRTW